MRIPLRRLWREWRGLVFFILGMVLFRSAVADWMVVPSGSMNPTVVEGDRVLVNKHAYGWRVPFTLDTIWGRADPARGDVVVLQSPVSSETLLKRVIAVPGDVVELRGDELTLNGKPVRYLPLPASAGDELLARVQAQYPIFREENLPGKPHEVMLLPDQTGRRDFGPVTIPAGKYLVMGDNRDNSFDSRYFGLVDRRAIFGRAMRVLVSLDPSHYDLPRRGRFLGPAL